MDSASCGRPSVFGCSDGDWPGIRSCLRKANVYRASPRRMGYYTRVVTAVADGSATAGPAGVVVTHAGPSP